MKNKIIDINNEYVTIQVSNGDELFIIDRFIYDNFWESELSTHTWIVHDGMIDAWKCKKLPALIMDLLDLNKDSKVVTLKKRKENNIFDIRLSNIHVLGNDFTYINNESCICWCDWTYNNSKIGFIFDSIIYDEISKYNWGYYKYSNNDGRFRTKSNGKSYSLKEIILKQYNLDSILEYKCANSVKLKDNNIHNNVFDYRINNFLIHNEIIRITDKYVLIKPTNNYDIFIIDRFIYDKYYNQLFIYYWFSHNCYIATNLLEENRLHRLIIRLLGLNIDEYIVHHINCNPLDNRIENLFICGRNLHRLIHTYLLENDINLKSNVMECISNKSINPIYSSSDCLNNFIINPKNNIIKPFLFIE